MEEANKFIDNILSNSNNVNVAKLGEVLKFDSSTMTADIQPLPSSDNDIAINVPVMTFETNNFYIYNPISEGDLVLLIYIDNDIDAFLMGQDTVNSNRQHSDSDVICVGGVPRLSNPINIEESDRLVLSNKSNTGSISIAEDGNIDIKGKNITITASQVDIQKG